MSDHSPVEPAEPPGEDAPATAPAEPERPSDGLDLARALTRATANAPAPATKRPTTKRRRSGSGRRGPITGARPDDRDPQTLSSTLGRLVDDHGWDLSLRVHGVFGRWEEIVGDDIAAHCSPETFRDGDLVVRTSSTAWATQLKLLAPDLVRRLNEELGHGTVTRIQVRGPHGPTWKKGPRSVRDGRGPRDTYG